jgi:hypothetical protein
MAIRDKAVAFLSQLNPAMQTGGANIGQLGANVLQQGANVLADASDRFLPNASNMLNASSQNLLNMRPGAQAALGYGALGAGALTAGAAGAALARGNKKRKERLAGQNLGAQLGVQMPIVY